MAQQSSNGNRPKLSEKGLLTPDNCVVALIDHQGQMLFGTSNFDRQGIINNTVAFGKAARVFDVPVVLTTVETKSFSGNMWPQLRAVFPGQDSTRNWARPGSPSDKAFECKPPWEPMSWQRVCCCK